ncbi:MAG TPA: DUF1150 family protein [Rickettsiales bacterium]|nr:DUF1150 family protein [Rickettsiales bacterium]
MDILPEALQESAMTLEMDNIAYIKPFSSNGEAGYAVHLADGKQLAVFESYESAFFTARQYNLAPLSVH